MSINQIAIIVHENEQVIKDLAQNMHLWVAASENNRAVVHALWKLDTPKDFELSYYDVPMDSTAEEQCLIAMDLVEAHHSSVFGAEPWLEIQIHGCNLTRKLESEFKEFGNITLAKQDYGFNVTRASE